MRATQNVRFDPRSTGTPCRSLSQISKWTPAGATPSPILRGGSTLRDGRLPPAMKALKASTLHSLNPLLDVLRAHPALREVRPAEFALDDKDFVHFHEDSDDVFADVCLKEEGRVHMPVSSPAEQAEFLERIDRTLEALEQREEMRGRRGRNKMRAV